MVKFKTVIEGVSDLLQSNCQVMGNTPPKSPEQIPAWLEMQVYRGEDGGLYHPSAAIRNSFLEGAKLLKIGKKNAKTVLMGIVSVYPEMYTPITRDGKPVEGYEKLTTSAVNKNMSSSVRIITHRPKITLPWEMEFIFEVNNDYFDINDTSIKQLKDIFNQAGAMVGIGCWRPQKSGLFGRFKVKEFTQI
jgi:hypothetical protein